MKNWENSSSVKFISKERIKDGNSNPWATSSTSEYMVILESDYEQEVRLYTEKQMKTHPQAPMYRKIESIKEMGGNRWNVKYSETIYYN